MTRLGEVAVSPDNTKILATGYDSVLHWCTTTRPATERVAGRRRRPAVEKASRNC